MYIPTTTVALLLLTVVMILLRIFWLRVPRQLRSFLIRGAITTIILHALFEVTKWSTMSGWLNVLISWMATAGYELLVLLFSRQSPRWLTIPSAAILLVPLFASSILLPLVPLFRPGSAQKIPIDNRFFYEVHPWENAGGGNTGVDLVIYYRPPLAPFLRRKLQTIPFNNQECNASAAFAITLPGTKNFLGRCPHWPSQSPGTFDKVLPLH
jgi:hypothetical protein